AESWLARRPPKARLLGPAVDVIAPSNLLPGSFGANRSVLNRRPRAPPSEDGVDAGADRRRGGVLGHGEGTAVSRATGARPGARRGAAAALIGPAGRDPAPPVSRPGGGSTASGGPMRSRTGGRAAGMPLRDRRRAGTFSSAKPSWGCGTNLAQVPAEASGRVG